MHKYKTCKCEMFWILQLQASDIYVCTFTSTLVVQRTQLNTFTQAFLNLSVIYKLSKFWISFQLSAFSQSQGN